MLVESLPKGWSVAAIDKIAGKCNQRKPADDEEFVYVDIGSIDRDTKKIAAPQYLLGKDAPSRARKEISTGDVIVSLTRPNLNAVALVDDAYHGQIASTGFEVLKPLLLESKYLFAIVRSRPFVDAISGKVQGALYPAAKATDVRSYKIPVPPLAEQQEIVARLDTLLAQVDTLKSRLDALPAILKRFRQSVLAAAVSGKLTEEWRLQFQAKEWIATTLGGVIKDGPQNGIYKPSKLYGSGTKIIRIDGFYDGEIMPWDGIKRVQLEEKEVAKWQLNISDILINRVNSIEYLGKCGLIRELPETAVFESNIMRITLDTEKALPEYVTLFLSSVIGLGRLRENAKLAVNQASINQGDVKGCIIELPELYEQTEIVRRVEQLFAFADQVEQRVKDAQNRVNHLTQSILAKAFRGELTADWRQQHPELITGEHSAEALLARIQAERAAQTLAQTPARRGRKKAV